MVTDILKQNTEIKQKILLFDKQIEQMILGALLHNNNNCDIVADILQSCYFYEELHQRIYIKIMEMRDSGVSADPISLKHFISKDVAFKESVERGSQYLMSLVHESLVLFNIKDMCLTIKYYYLMRCTRKLCNDTVDAIEGEENISKIEAHIEDIEKKLFDLGAGKSDNIRKINTLASETLKEIKKMSNKKNKEDCTGISTGFEDLDTLLDGLHNSDLIILAARPSMGKTALAINMAVNIATKLKKENEKADVEQKNIAFLSLEMSAEQLLLRITGMKSGVNIHAIRRGMITEEQLSKIDKVVKDEISTMPLIIDDSSTINMTALRARLRRLKRKENISCVFIDYLQLLNNDKSSDRNREISEITQTLKALAKELDIPIIVLSQLSRAVELREDKLPQLSDLRESGSIEQDADVVIFLYREAYYEERKKPKEEDIAKFTAWQQKMEQIINQADLIIAKHRNGPIGFRKLFFDRNTTVFHNYKKHN